MIALLRCGFAISASAACSMPTNSASTASPSLASPSGRPAESEKLLRQWLPAVQEHYGSNGYQTLQFHGMLGDALLLEHRFAEAEIELSAQLDGMAKLVDPENRTLIDDMRHLADAYGGQDKWQE